MFQKLVAIEPVSLVLSAEKALYSFADEVVMYSDIPAGDNEIIARIGDADAILLSYTSQINRYILERCPNVRVYRYVLFTILSRKCECGYPLC